MGKLAANNLVVTASAAVTLTGSEKQRFIFDSSLTLDENV